MFVLCPHCQFLVAVDPRSGRPPATCPKCDGPMEAPAPEQQASEQAAQDGAGAPTETIAPARDEPPPPMAPAEWSAPTPLMPPAPEPPDALSEAIASIVVADAPPAQLSADAVIAAMAAKAPRKPRAKSSTDTAPARPARRKRAETTDAATATPTPTRAPAPAPAKKPARAAGPTIQQRIATWLAAMQPKPKAKPAATTPAVETPKPVETPKRKASVKPIASLRDRAKAKAAEASVAAADQPTSIETGATESSAIESNAIETDMIEAVTTELTLEPMAIEPVAVAPVMTEWTLEPIEVKPDTIDSVATEPALALFEPDIGTIEPVPSEPLVIEHIVEDVIAPVVAGPLAASPVPGEQDVVPRAAEIPVAPIAPAPAVALVARVERAARPRASSHAPSFARTRGGGLRAIASQGPVSSEWIRAGAVGVLALLLGLQLLLAQSETLAANARWRPTVNALCGVFRCTTPAWRQPEAFTMLSRDVRPHPRAAGTLQIDASFRNDARWPQGWPLLVVSLSDIDGRIVGTRAFSAHEYLGAEVTQNTLGPGQTAAISLAVVEPAPGIVAFSFDFR